MASSSELLEAIADVKFHLAKNYPHFNLADTNYVWSMLQHIELQNWVATRERVSGMKLGGPIQPGDTREGLIREFEETIGRAQQEQKDVL